MWRIKAIKGRENDLCNVEYIAKCDPCGNLPRAVVNLNLRSNKVVVQQLQNEFNYDERDKRYDFQQRRKTIEDIFASSDKNHTTADADADAGNEEVYSIEENATLKNIVDLFAVGNRREPKPVELSDPDPLLKLNYIPVLNNATGIGWMIRLMD